MTRKHSFSLLEQATNLIFEVELAISKDDTDIARKQGYRARIEVANLMNLLRDREENNISEMKVNI